MLSETVRNRQITQPVLPKIQVYEVEFQLRCSPMTGIAIITEACIDVKDRACVDVCPVQCIYEYIPKTNVLASEVQAGDGIIENSHTPNADAIAIFGDSMLYVNLDECTSCTACYQPDVCPVGAIYPEQHVPNGTTITKYNKEDTGKGNDHSFFVQNSRDVFIPLGTSWAVQNS